MSKRTQKDSGEERVTEKSKPMMNLVSRCSERRDCWQWEANGQCSEGDNCSFRKDIHLQILSRSRVREMRREPEVPEAEVQVVECLDGPARITSMDLAPIHSVKSGNLQNACSTRPRALANLAKSAHLHIVRLMNNLVKGPKRMMTRVQPCWRRMIDTMMYGNLSALTKVTIDRSGLIRIVLPIISWNEDLLDVDHRMHDYWVAYFRTWSSRSLSYGRVQTCRNQSNVWNSRMLLHVILKFDTKILSSDWFAQVNLVRVAPTLQILRTGLRRRQSGKSKVPAKQRGGRPKVF